MLLLNTIQLAAELIVLEYYIFRDKLQTKSVFNDHSVCIGHTLIFTNKISYFEERNIFFE